MISTTSGGVFDLDETRLATWLTDRIDNYLASPPDMDFNVGYLAALTDAYSVIRGESEPRVQAARALVNGA
ncbi:hypothetical protein L2449_29215 [Mesorhizobium muleiense]|uniref:hypothetical protein n=1 Tax=Mesorhizobium muleiense TaxID=1004279 RepID=UPI001F216648|nr:hypothetical protein [Mesorhizobium muleiense]MCF6120910.1 hypothetical protein [Mesorhizobium muleiense]